MTRIYVLKLILAFFASYSMTALTAPSPAKIVLFGDFGTGAADQKLVADDIIAHCAAKGCDYAITTGDNIYPRGVESIKNGKADYDKGTPNYAIIIERFVNMYGKLKMPFYMSFGNHDVGNEGPISIFKDFIKSDEAIKKRTIGLMNNQINFSNHKDNPAVVDGLGRASRLWFFPDEYYHTSELGNVNLFALNTNAFPHRVLNDTKDAVHRKEKNDEQRTWLDDKLQSTAGSWQIVFGHMPLHSRGLHNWMEESDLKKFRNDIVETLCRNKVPIYVSGHDHHLEVSHHQCDNGHVILSVLTGAAAKRGRIYKSAFPIFSSEKHFLWGNGKHFAGDKSIYTDSDFALGFGYLEIIDDNNAKLTMKLSYKNSNAQTDGCFRITKGVSITRTNCN